MRCFRKQLRVLGLTTLAITSLLLAAVFVLSFFVRLNLGYRSSLDNSSTHERDVAVSAVSGRVELTYGRYNPRLLNNGPLGLWANWGSIPRERSGGWGYLSLTQSGAWGTFTRISFLGFHYIRARDNGFDADHYLYAMPLILLVFLFALLPAINSLWMIRSRWRRRHGRCANCGYDVRGSTNCCSECGADLVHQPAAASTQRRAE